ncbi:MAG: DUF4197 domain-containing protein [Rhodocyclaceae bacterium]|nr:DUF4197 domain-containing protein [Rhodocyclaceae bacterium]MBK6554603.1 DUF4197 domain-containing protein [Rhodocyclaceae bacterium]MBK9310118.1 DUF4197 domain-containing protein [Rhodocyclaceae bacterium]MBK9954808.1 DUF4197 domain-containing protein [Rhodocyclaceae bacterium]
MRKFLVFIAVLLFSSVSPALTLDQISGTESAGGLKEALTQGAGKAVELLGAKDGFLGNPKVKIGLPGNLDKAAKMMRKLGMGGTIDELETAMNRAAEAAVPEAKKLLVDSIKSMSVDDAKGILTGGDNAATEYFKRSTSEPLKEKFKPIVQQAMAKVKVADAFDNFAGKAATFGVIKKEDAQLDNYVTGKALDGLYKMIAEEEKAIRSNPIGAAGNLAKKVFGALGK